jgi:hypothetical protein
VGGRFSPKNKFRSWLGLKFTGGFFLNMFMYLNMYMYLDMYLNMKKIEHAHKCLRIEDTEFKTTICL